VLLNPLKIHLPNSVKEAAELYASLDEVKILAGGTFLLNTLKLLKRKGSKTPQHVISLKNVKELDGVIDTGDTLEIGAMTRINDLYDHDFSTGNLGILKTVCKNISTHPIRNMATVGGNLTCRYTWTEMPATMIALDAKMHFSGADGKEEVMDAETFYQNNAKTNKIFTKVSIPNNKSAKFAYRRVKKTLHVDIPLLSICINTEIKNKGFQNTRIGINNCVVFAQRDTALEEFLNSNPMSEKLAITALDHLTDSIYDKRSGEYKKEIFRRSLKSAINELVRNNT